jgi:hypothetical protein
LYTKRRCINNETDIPAKDKTEKKGAWLQTENEDKERQKYPEEQKIQRKKEFISIKAAGVAFIGL